MKTISQMANDIGWDKVAHFTVSGWLVTILAFYTNNLLLSAGIVMGVGLAKEIFDARVRGGSGFGVADLEADWLGVTVSVGLLMIKGA